MDMVVSIVASDLITRLISRLINEYQNHMSVEKRLRRLLQVLIKIHATVEEAERRHITNKWMLLLLKRFLEGLYRGYYMLDAFQCHHVKESMVDEVHHSESSLFNPAKRVRMIAKNAKVVVFGDRDVNELQTVLRNLEDIVADMREFSILLRCYPRRFRQPYSTYLYMDKCMFGRHVEKEQIINFLLLQPEPPSSAPNVGVLPIISPYRIGKRTLVENVCKDERVLNYFSFILELCGDDLENGALEAQTVSLGTMNHKIRSSKYLVIVEFALNVDMDAWGKFYIYASNCMAFGSKIIIISRIEEAASLGTLDSIRLKLLPEEAYWYYFKAIAFGSTNPEEHPKLVTIGMEIAKVLNGGFIGANAFGEVLRANLNVQFWSSVLKSATELVNGHFISLPDQTTKFHKNIVSKAVSRISFEDVCAPPNLGPTCILIKSKREDIIHKELPELTFSDILSSDTTVIPARFKVIVWRSPLPPYSSFLAICKKKVHHNM